MQWLLIFYRTAWRTSNTGIVVPMFKKDDHKDCNNYRGITLLSLPGKAWARVFEKRCRPIVEAPIQEEQCGFRMGRNATDKLFTRIHFMDKSREYGKEILLCLVDLEKGKDRIPRDNDRFAPGST